MRPELSQSGLDEYRMYVEKRAATATQGSLESDAALMSLEILDLVPTEDDRDKLDCHDGLVEQRDKLQAEIETALRRLIALEDELQRVGEERSVDRALERALFLTKEIHEGLGKL